MQVKCSKTQEDSRGATGKGGTEPGRVSFASLNRIAPSGENGNDHLLCKTYECLFILKKAEEIPPRMTVSTPRIGSLRDVAKRAKVSSVYFM